MTGRAPETSLYPPVKAFLESQGYLVKGEVLDCDVLGERDGVLVAVELKSVFNLKLVLQAVDRLASVDWVYVAVPCSAAALAATRRQVHKLLRMLGIGLLLVEPGRGLVTAALDPGEYRPRRMPAKRGRLLKEHGALIGDPNPGGGTKRRGIMTAYRQRAIAVARHLSTNGPSRASTAGRATGVVDAWSIMARNYYGWFERTAPGIFDLTPRGTAGMAEWGATTVAEGEGTLAEAGGIPSGRNQDGACPGGASRVDSMTALRPPLARRRNGTNQGRKP